MKNNEVEKTIMLNGQISKEDGNKISLDSFMNEFVDFLEERELIFIGVGVYEEDYIE